MTGADLVGEYRTALNRTRFRDLAPLVEAGVGGAGLAIGPAVAAIRVLNGGVLFEPDPESDAKAFILPVRADSPHSPEAVDPVEAVRAGEIVDLLAFSPRAPHRWALRTGAATWLGAVGPQYLMPDPVPIWRSPLYWLGCDCRGLVLLSRDRRDRYRVLTWLDSILAEDETHADELRELLARPWLAPQVLVRRAREVRRAA